MKRCRLAEWLALQTSSGRFHFANTLSFSRGTSKSLVLARVTRKSRAILHFAQTDFKKMLGLVLFLVLRGLIRY